MSAADWRKAMNAGAGRYAWAGGAAGRRVTARPATGPSPRPSPLRGEGEVAAGAWVEWITRRVRARHLLVLLGAIVIGLGLWWFLARTKVGMMIRAGVDDRGMLAASGVNVQLVFAITFAIGAGLAGFAGVVGGTALSIAPGEDTRYQLASLVVVIVGGMGSVVGAAIGAILIGVAEQFGLAYAPTYSVVFTFVIMALVLAFRPQGILGRRT